MNKKARIMVGVVVVALLMLLLFVEGHPSKAALRARLDGWDGTLNSIPGHEMDYGRNPGLREAELAAITAYLEPGAMTAKRALALHFFAVVATPGKWRVVSKSVDEIKIDGDSASVRYGFVLMNVEGERRTATEYTRWVRHDGEWYRSIEGDPLAMDPNMADLPLLPPPPPSLRNMPALERPQ